MKTSWRMLGGAVATWLTCGACGDGGTDPSAPARVVLNPADMLTLDPGEHTPVQATVYARSGHALAGRAIAYASSADAIVSVSASGELEAHDTPGRAEITASNAGITSEPLVVIVRDLHGVAAAVEKVDDVPTDIHVAETDTVKVRVIDRYGDPVRNVPVTFTASVGQVSASFVRTDVGGIAAVAWTMSPYRQAHTLRVTAATDTVAFSAMPLPGPPVDVALSHSYIQLYGSSPDVELSTSLDAYGNGSGSIVSVVSRNPAVFTASRSPQGEVTVTPAPGAMGSAFLVATSNSGAADSMIVVCVPYGSLVVGPGEGWAIRPLAVPAGGTFQLPLSVSGASIGSITLDVTWDPTLLSYSSQGNWDPLPIALNLADTAAGRLRLSLASTARVQTLLYITFRVVGAAGHAGAVVPHVIEAGQAGTFNDLLPVTLSVAFPFEIR